MKLIFSSVPNEGADDLAEALLEARVVACVNIVPGARSIYRWEGRLERGGEALLWMETTDESVDAAMAALAAAHPYEVPKIVALDPDAVNASYLSWLRAEVRPPNPT